MNMVIYIIIYINMNKIDLFLELSNFNNKIKISDYVDVNNFKNKYESLKLGNGGDWCRFDGKFGKYYKIITIKNNEKIRYSWDINEIDKKIIISNYKNFIKTNKILKKNGNSIRFIKIVGIQKKPYLRNIKKKITNELKIYRCVVCGSTHNIQIDHKNGLYDEKYIYDIKLQKKNYFQTLCNHCNCQKRESIKNMKKTNIRYKASNIPQLKIFNVDYIEGDEKYNKNNINDTKGTYWYDPIKFIKTIKERQDLKLNRLLKLVQHIKSSIILQNNNFNLINNNYDIIKLKNIFMENNKNIINLIDKSNYNNKIKLCVLDLFCGAGGLSYGLEMTNKIKIKVANEIDKYACETFKENHKQCKLIKGDITDIKIKNIIINECIKNKVNIIVGGIPCVAFSMAGKRNIFDKRGFLYKDYFYIVKNINPQICVIENVKGLKSIEHFSDNIPNEIKNNIIKDFETLKKNKEKNIMKKIKKKYKKYLINLLNLWLDNFKQLGYNCDFKILKSSDYGVPQHRERIFIIASKLKNNVILFPNKTHNEYGSNGLKKWITVKESIDDLKFLDENIYFSHIFRKYKTTKIIDKIKKCPYDSSYTGYGESNRKCNPNTPSNTVKENHGAVFVHYEIPRHLTPRELARLQSFPDKFIFKLPKGQIFKQIGNAVPCKLGYHIGLTILKLFEINNIII